MEDTKVAVVIRWNTWDRTTIEKMAKRFGFEPYVSVNRKTGALIKKEDMNLLEECARRGIIAISNNEK